jgi:hypothetical protein
MFNVFQARPEPCIISLFSCSFSAFASNFLRRNGLDMDKSNPQIRSYVWLGVFDEELGGSGPPVFMRVFDITDEKQPKQVGESRVPGERSQVSLNDSKPYPVLIFRFLNVKTRMGKGALNEECFFLTREYQVFWSHFFAVKGR